MKHLKEYKEIDWFDDNYYDEEIEPFVELKIGDCPVLRNDCKYYFRSQVDEFEYIDDTGLVKITDNYYINTNKVNRYEIDDIKIYKDTKLIHFNKGKVFWYDIKCWELKQF